MIDAPDAEDGQLAAVVPPGRLAPALTSCGVMRDTVMSSTAGAWA